MESPELSISVGELIGIPKVSVRGYVDSWHDQAILGVLAGLRDQGITSMVLDLAGMSFVGTDGASGLIGVLRSVGPAMCVHVVGSSIVLSILNRAGFNPSIRLYSSTDEIRGVYYPH